MATLTQGHYDAIPWKAVESSNIDRIAWVQTGEDAMGFPIGELYVEFLRDPRRAYRYADVPQAVFANFEAAESAGGFFAEAIRGRYEHEHVRPIDDE